MRDEKEERKKQARSNKQTRQSNTAHPRQSLACTCCHVLLFYIAIYYACTVVLHVAGHHDPSRHDQGTGGETAGGESSQGVRA